jgi:hypothetical protein
MKITGLERATEATAMLLLFGSTTLGFGNVEVRQDSCSRRFANSLSFPDTFGGAVEFPDEAVNSFWR